MADYDQSGQSYGGGYGGNPNKDASPGEGGDKKKKKPGAQGGEGVRGDIGSASVPPPVRLQNYGNQTGFGGLSDIVQNQIAGQRARFGSSLATLRPSLASTTRRSLFGL